MNRTIEELIAPRDVEERKTAPRRRCTVPPAPKPSIEKPEPPAAPRPVPDRSKLEALLIWGIFQRLCGR